MYTIIKLKSIINYQKQIKQKKIMDKILKESFSVFGRTTLRKFGKMKIYIEGLSKV